MNTVISGAYKGTSVALLFGKASINGIPIDKNYVTSCDQVTEEHRISLGSSLARGAVGGALLGPVGMIAGGISGKNKGTYTLAITWSDNQRSLIEVDDKTYKAILKEMF